MRFRFLNGILDIFFVLHRLRIGTEKRNRPVNGAIHLLAQFVDFSQKPIAGDDSISLEILSCMLKSPLSKMKWSLKLPGFSATKFWRWLI